jgi:excisionase family DNA binding protein
MDRLLTIQQVSERLNLATPTLYKMACQKRIPTTRVCGRLLFSEAALERWIVERTEEPIGSRTV